jgi:hypothetical protein
MPKRKKADKSPDTEQESEETSEIKIPKYVLQVYKTEDEQKMYRILCKVCDMCKRLNARYSEWPKHYAKKQLSEIREDMRTAYGRKRLKKKSVEDKIWGLRVTIDSIFYHLGINDIKAYEILQDYDGFNEKFKKKIEEYTKRG